MTDTLSVLTDSRVRLCLNLLSQFKRPTTANSRNSHTVLTCNDLFTIDMLVMCNTYTHINTSVDSFKCSR